MKKINKYDNGGDPPVKQPDYLQYKGPYYFNAGSPAYDMETYQKAITRDSTALADAFFPSWMFDEMKRLQLNRQLRNKIKPYTYAEIRDLNLVGEQYTGPAVDMDMFMQQYMESGIDDQAYGGEVSEYKGGGLWANIHAKRARGERMRKKGEKGAPTEAQMARARAAHGGKSMDVDYEAEGGEVVIGDISVNRMYNGGTAKQYKGANMFMLGGPSHADGGIGIKVNSDEPSYVFTDRLKVGGMKGATYADMAAKFGNELDNVTTMAMGGDKYDRTTAKLMRPRLMEDVEDLFNDQEEFKRENNIDQEPKEAGLGAAFAAMATKAGLSKGLAAAQFLPGLINIGKGLFGKAPELEYDTIVPEMQDYQDFNPLMQSYLGQQNRSLATLRAGLEGSGISGAGLRGSFQAGISGSQANAANFLSQLGQMQAQSDRATDQFNISQQTAAQQANMQAEMMADQFAMQNDPSRAFSQGLSQILGTATSLSRQGLQRDLLNRMFPAAYGGKYGIK